MSSALTIAVASPRWTYQRSRSLWKVMTISASLIGPAISARSPARHQSDELAERERRASTHLVSHAPRHESEIARCPFGSFETATVASGERGTSSQTTSTRASRTRTSSPCSTTPAGSSSRRGTRARSGGSIPFPRDGASYPTRSSTHWSKRPNECPRANCAASAATTRRLVELRKSGLGQPAPRLEKVGGALALQAPRQRLAERPEAGTLAIDAEIGGERVEPPHDGVPAVTELGAADDRRE